jgi:ATP-dependent helicase HrpB
VANIDLPIDSRLDEIAGLVRSSDAVILTAAPGAGKTTRVPPRLIPEVNGKIIVLQPRRLAAVAACHRICEEQVWTVGREAGYQVRFESKVQKDTKLVFMTDAMLLRQISADPDLSGVSLVILDEFHERNLNQDLALAYLREQQMLGREIKIMVMSATLSLDRLKRHLGGAAVVDVEGRTFPLEVRHQTSPIILQTHNDFIERAARAVGEGLKEADGDILVFLPGVGEINRLGERLGGGAFEVQPLHGSLPLKEQQAVLRPPGSRGGDRAKRRVILSTNVAEASVTVPGVNCVIDTGVARIMQCNLKTGFSQLELQRISLFNATQRAGRAGREREGLCIRLWTSFEESTQALEPVAECQRVDLSSALLWLSELGITRFEKFSWLDQPSGRLLDFARKSLLWIGAIDSDNRITSFGRELARFPLAPRWGALLVMGENRGFGGTAAQVAALMSERDVVREPRGGVASVYGTCDVWRRLEMLEDRGGGRSLEMVRETARQLASMVKPDKSDCSLEDLQELLLLSQGDRLCRKRTGAGSAESERALMVGQRGVRLAPESSARNAEFFVALQGIDLPGQADTQISIASGFNKNFLLKHLADKVKTTEDVYFDEDKQQFFGRRGRFVFDLPIDVPSLTPVSPDQVTEAMAAELIKRWDWLRENHAGLRGFWSRWEFLLQHKPELAGELTEEKLREALAMAAYGSVSLKQILEKDVVGFIKTALGRDVSSTLDKDVPAEFAAPSGVSHKIDYSEKHSAYVDVRLQEVFGLPQSPRLVSGKVPITFRLLGPNYRPVQVTSDLANFWRSAYHEVRKELRSRYPKHSWPEDGLTAKPEAKGRRRN